MIFNFRHFHMNLEEVIGCFLWIETGNSSPICCGLRHKHIDFDLTLLKLLISAFLVKIMWNGSVTGHKAKETFYVLKNSFLTFFLFGFCLFLGQFSTRKRVRAQNTTKPKCHAGITLPSVKLCSRVAVVISKYVHEWETFHCYLLMS